MRAPESSARGPAADPIADLCAELRATHCSNENLHDNAADALERLARDHSKERSGRIAVRAELSAERDRHKRTSERAERAEAERDALLEVVRELVACDDESNNLAAARLYGKPHMPEYKARELDYRQRKIEAWRAARAKVDNV